MGSSYALIGLFVLAVLYSIHFARGFLIPIVLARLLAFFLTPPVRGLRRARVPEAVGAAVVLLVLLGIGLAAAYELADPAREWMGRVPEGLRRLESEFRVLRGPVHGINEAFERIERMANVGGDTQAPEVQVKGPSYGRLIFGGTLGFLSSMVIVLFLTYFLLATGDLLLQKIVQLLPQFKDKKRAVAIVREIERQTSVYLGSITIINLGVGLATALAMLLLGMPNPLLWGAIAWLLNYIPYLGAIGTIGIFTVAGLLAFEDLGRSLLVPGAFVLINVLEAYVATPLVHSRRLTLNPVAVFVGLLFWWFVWGIPGALLAVPMVATFKILCDHIEALSPVGQLLGR